MDTYELIEYAIKVGLLTAEVAHVLHNYIQKNKQSQYEDQLRRVIEEALNYFEEHNSQQKCKEPFSDVNLLNQFMNTTQSIFDLSIQELCDRIMSHELVSPGVTPQRIFHILSIISFEDMQKFQIICSMNIGIVTNYNNDSRNNPIAERRVMVPFKNSDEYSQKIGIYLEDIHELQSLGLLTYSPSGSYLSGYPCKHPLVYANGKTFYVLWHHKDEIPIGNILLTRAGECLFNVINECEIANEYDIYVREFMENFGVTFAEQDMYSVAKTNGEFFLTAKRKKIPYCNNE